MKPLKTKRLIIEPLGDGQLEKAVENEPDEHMRTALFEMLDGCRKNPTQRLWYTCWLISLRADGQKVGSIAFLGAPSDSAVEFGYGIDEPFRNNGYAFEAARAIVNWAFGREDVYFVFAETEPENAASRHILEKLGFKYFSDGAEGPRFIAERPQTSWMAVYMCLGLSVGLSLGMSFGSQSTGMCVGMACGLAIGTAMDSAEKKKRAEKRGKLGLPENAKDE